MRKIVLISIGLLMISVMTVAQEAHPSRATALAKAVTLSGTISNDGKTFVSERDDAWTIANADVVKGREGQQVVVKCSPDSARQSIHVFFVKPAETRYPANWGDSAFRR
ncbi:MAG: hypothetical protein WB952_04925 [Terriglobales bacterium]